MAIYNASFISDQIKNNSGTSLNSGNHDFANPSTTSILNLPYAVKNSPFGSTVIDSVGVTSSHFSSYEIPRNNPRPLIKRVSSATNLTSVNNVLRTAGNLDTQSISSIHYIESTRTRLEKTAFREGQFNILTGKYSAGYPDSQYDSFSSDTAARVGRRYYAGAMVFQNSKTIEVKPYTLKTG